MTWLSNQSIQSSDSSENQTLQTFVEKSKALKALHKLRGNKDDTPEIATTTTTQTVVPTSLGVTSSDQTVVPPSSDFTAPTEDITMSNTELDPIDISPQMPEPMDYQFDAQDPNLLDSELDKAQEPEAANEPPESPFQEYYSEPIEVKDRQMICLMKHLPGLENL